MIVFLYIVSTRENLCSSYYFSHVDKSERAALESAVVKTCVSARESKCSFLEYKDYKIIHRQYNTLLFIVGTDEEENELAIYEFIQLFVETLDKHFNTVNEQHLHEYQDTVRIILQGMIVNGYLVETNFNRIFSLLQMVEKHGAVKK